MAPLTAWLPAESSAYGSDLALTIVGDGVGGLGSGIRALERALADQGFTILAQRGRLDGLGLLSTVRLRVSSQPLHSMGNGCDVLLYLCDGPADLTRFCLQQGSAMLCEASVFNSCTATCLPDNVVTYRIPFSEVSRRYGGAFSGRELIAIGVLTHHLGIDPEMVRRRMEAEFRVRYFNAGLEHARLHLTKRDVHALPVQSSGQRCVLLNVEQTFLLARGISSCDCGDACADALDASPDMWITEHVKQAQHIAFYADRNDCRLIDIHRHAAGQIKVVTGVADPADILRENPCPTILPGADLKDLLQLVSLAYQLIRSTDRSIWVIADHILANRAQSVALRSLRAVLPFTGGGVEWKTRQRPILSLTPEREGDPEAEVGYIAWGTAQGIVREAVDLCRSFGLPVAALYPKVFWPLPLQALETFAASVKRMVVVESETGGSYGKVLKRYTSLPMSIVGPEQGKALTPLDLFLHEGLGVPNQIGGKESQRNGSIQDGDWS